LVDDQESRNVSLFSTFIMLVANFLHTTSCQVIQADYLTPKQND